MNKNDSTVICIYYRYSINKLTSTHNNILLSGIFVNLGVGNGLQVHVFKITTPLWMFQNKNKKRVHVPKLEQSIKTKGKSCMFVWFLYVWTHLLMILYQHIFSQYFCSTSFPPFSATPPPFLKKVSWSTPDFQVRLTTVLILTADKNDKQLLLLEEERFTDFDKNRDGILDKKEIKDWVLPDNNEAAVEEAEHLIERSDADKDGKLSIDEIVSNHEDFVGSQATNYGEFLPKDEL